MAERVIHGTIGSVWTRRTGYVWRYAAALLLAGCASAQPSAADLPPATPLPRATELASVPDGPVGSSGFEGVLVQRTTHFETGNTNDSIPDFDRQVYDTADAWSPDAPDRIVIPDDWDGEVGIVHVRAAWAGHSDRWVELKLYRNAERPIGNEQEDRLLAVVQVPTNPDSPFVELTTPPLPLQAGDELLIAFKTPNDRLLISYQEATTLFGVYLVGS